VDAGVNAPRIDEPPTADTLEAASVVVCRGSAKRTAEEQAAERTRRAAERRTLREKRLDEIQSAVEEKCKEAKHATWKRTNDGFIVKFDAAQLVLELHDLGDAEVDFWGSLKVQRWQRDFYVKPDGHYVSVWFRPHPLYPPRPAADLRPRDGAQFREWAVVYARAAAPIVPEKTMTTPSELVHEGIEKLILLA
jgi:hypothetical protein